MRRLSLLFKQYSRSVFVIAGLAFLSTAALAQGDAAKGEAIFKANCTTCHKVDSKLIGPALGPAVTTDTDDKMADQMGTEQPGPDRGERPQGIVTFKSE